MESLTDVLKILYQIKFPIDIEKISRIGTISEVSYNGYGKFRFYECQKFFLIKSKSSLEAASEIKFYSEWARLFLNEDKFDLACEEFFQNGDEAYFLLKHGRGLLKFKEKEYFSCLEQILCISESMNVK